MVCQSRASIQGTVKKPTTLAWISGLTGLGLLILGGIAYSRQGTPTPISGLGWGRKGRRYLGRAKEAPVIGSYSSGGMTTVLREQERMPIEVRVASIQK